MHKIAISQRVNIHADRNERRDCLDQRWMSLLEEVGLLGIQAPNHRAMAHHLVKEIEFSGLILSGGNDLHSLGGDALERDDVEKFLIKHFLDNNKPILAVCRGMQLFLSTVNINPERLSGHTHIKHPVEGKIKRDAVISAHNWGFKDKSLFKDIEIMSVAPDGSVECCIDRKNNVLCIMWHPERETPHHREDIKLIKDLFKS